MLILDHQSKFNSELHSCRSVVVVKLYLISLVKMGKVCCLENGPNILDTFHLLNNQSEDRECRDFL